MLSVVLCSQNNNQTSLQEDSVEGYGAFTLETIPVHCGLVAVDSPDFDASDLKYANEVLIKVLAFSCNYRDKVILMSWASLANHKKNTGDDNSYFSCIGSEFVGEVVQVGKAVTDLKPGDRVIQDASFPLSRDGHSWGGLSTNSASSRFLIINQYKLLKIPQNISIETAAALTIAGQTVFGMINRLKLPEGAHILIPAAKSNTSTFAISALKDKYNVYALSSSDFKKEAILALGAKDFFVLDHQQSPYFKDFDRFNALVREIGGFDAVIDPFIDLHLDKLTNYIKLNGQYITCGFYQQYAGHEKVPFQFPGQSMAGISGDLITKNISILGHCLGSSIDLEQAIEQVSQGKVQLTIDSVYSGAQVSPFFDRTYNAKDRFGKVIYKY